MSQQIAIAGRPRGRLLPIAREGWPFLLPTAALTLAAAWLCWWWLAAALGLILAFMLNFFRDPERATPAGEGLIIAPADGRVVRAKTEGASARVDIFMNIFDVHVNRAPMAGRITHMQYFPGRFMNASRDKASELNERNYMELQGQNGELLHMTQIAGLVARRIVSYVAVGDQVEAGQRVGMIRFGSRVDCTLPAGYALCVQVGDRVKAGLTVLARRSGHA